MSVQYDEYLEQHKGNVRKGYEWFRDNMPELLVDIYGVDYAWQIGVAHDASKDGIEEYDAYDKYFYGKNRSYQVVQDFNVLSDKTRKTVNDILEKLRKKLDDLAVVE